MNIVTAWKCSSWQMKNSKTQICIQTKISPISKRYTNMWIQIERELRKVKTPGILGSWDLFLFTLFLFSERDKIEMKTQTSSHRNGLHSQSIISYWKLPPFSLSSQTSISYFDELYMIRKIQPSIKHNWHKRVLLSVKRFIL